MDEKAILRLRATQVAVRQCVLHWIRNLGKSWKCFTRSRSFRAFRGQLFASLPRGMSTSLQRQGGINRHNGILRRPVLTHQAEVVSTIGWYRSQSSGRWNTVWQNGHGAILFGKTWESRNATGISSFLGELGVSKTMKSLNLNSFAVSLETRLHPVALTRAGRVQGKGASETLHFDQIRSSIFKGKLAVSLREGI